MEFEDVSEKMEWEAQRVAAAFEVKTFMERGERQIVVGEENEGEVHLAFQRVHDYSGDVDGVVINWALYEATGAPLSVDVRREGENCLLFWPDAQNASQLLSNKNGVFYEGSTTPHLFVHELMARGLIRLSFEDESVLNQLPPLSAHEKAELRLSMPREFWPKTWLED